MSESVKEKLDKILQPYEAMLIEAFGDKKRYEHEKAFATLLMVENNALVACSPGSIITALVNVAHCETTLDPTLGLAYLIPRKQRKSDPVAECKLDISYKGMVGIAVDSGSVMDIDASVVRAGDEFEYEMGLNPDMRHRPAGQPNLSHVRGKITHVYAIAFLLNGIKKFVVLSAEDVEKVRRKSNRPDSLMWTDFEDTGYKKTRIKRLYTLLPKTKQTSHAVMVVNQNDGGIDFEKEDRPIRTTDDVSYEQPNYGPPELVKKLNALFDALGVNQAARDMHMAACGGDTKKLEALELMLSNQKAADKILKGVPLQEGNKTATEAVAESTSPAALAVVNIDIKTGKKRDKTEWTLYKITLSDGVVYSTFSKSIADEAQAAKDFDRDVVIEFTQTEKGRNLDKLTIVDKDDKEKNKITQEKLEETGKSLFNKD